MCFYSGTFCVQLLLAFVCAAVLRSAVGPEGATLLPLATQRLLGPAAKYSPPRASYLSEYRSCSVIESMATPEVLCVPPLNSQKHYKGSQLLAFPYSPELRVQESSVAMDPADTFIAETKILVEASVHAALKGAVYNYGGLSSGFKDMVHCVIDARRSNYDSFEEMCDQLELTSSNVYMSAHKVFANIFDDGINWGRIVALLAFGGHLADYCVRNRLGDVADSITPWVVLFIASFPSLKGWILEHGGWVNLVKLYFPQSRKQAHIQQKQHANEGSWLDIAMSGVQLGVHIFNVLNGK